MCACPEKVAICLGLASTDLGSFLSVPAAQLAAEPTAQLNPARFSWTKGLCVLLVYRTRFLFLSRSLALYLSAPPKNTKKQVVSEKRSQSQMRVASCGKEKMPSKRQGIAAQKRDVSYSSEKEAWTTTSAMFRDVGENHELSWFFCRHCVLFNGKCFLIL